MVRRNHRVKWKCYIQAIGLHQGECSFKSGVYYDGNYLPLKGPCQTRISSTFMLYYRMRVGPRPPSLNNGALAGYVEVEPEAYMDAL